MQDESVSKQDDHQGLLPAIHTKTGIPSGAMEGLEDLEMIANPSRNKLEQIGLVEATITSDKDSSPPVGMAKLPRANSPDKDKRKVTDMNGSKAKEGDKDDKKPAGDTFVPPPFDTIKIRGERIQKYSPEQYNQIYHLKNLKNIELLGDRPVPESILGVLVDGETNSEIIKKDNYWIESTQRSHICDGKIFSIATNRINNKKMDKDTLIYNDRIQKTSLAIFVHDPNDAQKRHSVKLFEKVLWANDQPHNWHSVAKPAVINNNKMYFATFQNSFDKTSDQSVPENNKIKHQIWCFDFKDCVAPQKPLYEREEAMVFSPEINKYFYACQTQLSIYIPINETTKNIDPSIHLTDDEFLKETFVSVRYRTHTERTVKEEEPGQKNMKKQKKEGEESNSEDEADVVSDNKYYSSVKVFHLKDFAQPDWGKGEEMASVHTEDPFIGSSQYKDSDIFPQIQFVMQGQFYILKRSKKMQIGQMEIEVGKEGDDDAGMTKLGSYQDVNKLRNQVRDYFMSFYLRPYSIINVNSGSEDIPGEHIINNQCWELPGQRNKRKGAKKGNQVKDDVAQIVPTYHEMAEHFKFINQDRKGLVKGKIPTDEDGNFDYAESNKIDSMNVIFNFVNDQPQVTMVVAVDNLLHAKIIDIRVNFTRMDRESGVSQRIINWGSIVPEAAKKGSMYGTTIRQDDFVEQKHGAGKIQQGDVQVKVRGQEGQSIYMEISYNRWSKIEKPKEDDGSDLNNSNKWKRTASMVVADQWKKENEVLLIEELQPNFDIKQFQSAALCWSGDLKQVKGSTDQSRTFLCGLLDKSGHVAQILEYKVSFNTGELKERCVSRKEAMGQFQYLNFLQKSHKIISLELVGMNLVVTKEPYDKPQLIITPYFTHESKMKELDLENPYAEGRFQVSGSPPLKKSAASNAILRDKHQKFAFNYKQTDSTLEYTFDKPILVKGYMIQAVDHDLKEDPTHWSIKDENGQVIHSVNGENFGDRSTKKQYTLEGNGSLCKKIVLNVLDTNGSTDECQIARFQIMVDNPDFGKPEFAQLFYKEQSVKIWERESRVFQIQSDVAKTMYKYYFDGLEKEPEVIHIQCVLSDLLENTSKSPDVDSISVINSIKQTNSRLAEQMAHGSFFGIPAETMLYLQQKYRKRQGLNQMDRFVLLKSACKSLLNMIPVNFQDFSINKERIDLLQPVETLDCQNECDFFLDQPSYVKSDLETEKSQGNAASGGKPLFPGIIQKFVKEMHPDQQKSVTDSLKDQNWWRHTHQIINALYFSNSLMRCFTQTKVRIQSAKLLVDHLMNNKITMTERDIIMSTLPHILDCDYEPFSFQKLSKFFTRPPMNQPGPNNGHIVSFSQNIKPVEEILFNDSPQEITMLDQRNFALSTPEFKIEMGTNQLIDDNDATDKELLTIPVEHYIIDFHSLYLFQKLTYIRTQKPVKNYSPLTIQEIMSEINGKFGYDIEKHSAIQKIIDAQYVSAQLYFTCMFAIYMFGFVFCFIAQMQMDDQPQVVRTLNGICLGVTIIFQLLSLVDFVNMKDKWDFFEFFNIINNTCYVVYYIYYRHRNFYVDFRYLPHGNQDKFDYMFQAQTSIMSIVILTGILIKSMDLVRFNNDMGKLVKLVFAVLYDVRFLFIFLVLNICLFSLYYLSLGYVMTKEKDVSQLIYWDYFIESWKIATKGARTEITTVWAESDYEALQNFVMVLTIFNEIYLKIIMLSFLIAIVKKTFDSQMKIAMQNSYEQRCDMNKESSTVIKTIGLLDQQDMFILSCQFESPPQPDKIDKFQKEMRGEMKQMREMIATLAKNQEKMNN